MREGVALADSEASDGAALPVVVGPPVEQRSVQARPVGAGKARVAKKSTSGSLTSRNTGATKLRAVVSAAAVLKVGTRHTRPVRMSMRTCRNLPERSGRSGQRAARGGPGWYTRRVARDRQGEQQACRRQAVGLDALTGAHSLLHRRRQAEPTSSGAPGRASCRDRSACAAASCGARAAPAAPQRRGTKAIAAWAAAAEQPVAADEGAARRTH